MSGCYILGTKRRSQTSIVSIRGAGGEGGGDERAKGWRAKGKRWAVGEAEG